MELCRFSVLFRRSGVMTRKSKKRTRFALAMPFRLTELTRYRANKGAE
jgi:hypothetical protein